MPYVVQADDQDGPSSKTVADRKEALALAVRWASEGRSRIRILGDGRIYNAQELPLAIINEEAR
jgi:hypothetical protein